MSLVEFEIKNWAKFNPRSDKANYSWFRFENSFFQDQAIFGLTDSQCKILIFCFCEVSKKAGKRVGLKTEYVSAMLGHKESNIIKDFEVLFKGGLLTSIGRPEGDFVPATYVTNDTYETNVTNEHDGPARTAHFDFESLYRKYPRKEGKTGGLAKCKAQIKTSEDFYNLSLAIEHYAAHVIEKQTEAKFIKHFSTFMTSWRDWLDPETGSAASTGFDVFANIREGA